MLLDGGYLRQLENVLMGVPESRRLQVDASLGMKTQHVFVPLCRHGTAGVDAVSGEKVSTKCNRITMRGYTVRDTTDSVKRRCGLIKIAKGTYGWLWNCASNPGWG
jgi:hypothetical protein